MQETLFGDDFEIGEEIGALEEWCRRQEIRWIVGVDEAGRGPLAGPVQTAAVAVDVDRLEAPWIALLDDSKKLAEDQREEAFGEIRESAPAFCMAASSPEVIDEINILEATRRAMLEAVDGVCHQLDATPDYLFVDGDTRLETPRPHRTLVRGDGRSYAIAAASILAKVSRDRLMVEYAEKWPGYRFASNKGYPTRAHRQAIAERGPCPIHRRSFGGVEEK